MRALLLAFSAVAALAGAPGATGQAYPSRPITLVVPFATGGPTDTLARLLAERMKTSLGQPVIVENTVGAAGSIGVGRVARAAPDGYTIGIGNWSTHVVNGAIYPLPYDLLKDLEPVALLTSNPQVIVAKQSASAHDLKDLVGWMKGNPDKVSAGTAGVGSASHVSGVYFQNLTGTRIQFVPYRGMGPALQDLVAGHIDVAFDQISNSITHVRAGRIKAYAITARTRSPIAPEIPTVDEAGVPGLYISVWHGLWAPPATPKAIVAQLNAAVAEAFADPAIRSRLSDLGQEIPAREQQSPEALAEHHRAEIAAWWPVIRAAGIKAE